METIVAAALQYNGVTISLSIPARHCHVMWSATFLTQMQIASATQGFLTSEGRFVNRVEARHIANRAKQKIIEENPHEIEAFSEDFW